MPPRLAAVVLPVGFLGFVVAAAAAISFAVSPRDVATLAGIAGLLAASTLAERYPVPLDGIDTGGVSLGFVFCTAAIVLYGWEAGVIVGLAAPIMHMLEHRPPIRVFYNASMLAIAAMAAGLAIAPLRGDDAALRLRAGARRGGHPLRGQPAADQPRRQRQLAEADRAGRPHQHHDLGHAVRVDGLCGLDARDPLAAVAVPLGRARRPAARDRALPALDVPGAAGDAARADRPADRARQPPPFPRPARARARRLARAGLSAQPLPGRHRRLQADQRPLRTSGRRQGARPAGDEPPPGRRGVPARRRRVRDPAARTRRGRLADRGRGDHRADRRGRARARRSRHDQRRHRDRAGGRAGPRRARPARGQRPLLGEGIRQEPGARLPARRDRDRRAEAPRRRARPGGALPRGGQPRAERSTRATPTRARTPSASPTSRPGSRPGSESTGSRSS